MNKLEINNSRSVEVSVEEANVRAFIQQWRERGGSVRWTDHGRGLTLSPLEAISLQDKEFVVKYKPLFIALLRLEIAVLTDAFEPDGFVYVLRAGPYFKIGRTVDLDTRVKQLKIQLPFAADLEHSIECQAHEESEKYWHERFQGLRVNGEWFALTPEALEEIKQCKWMRGGKPW